MKFVILTSLEFIFIPFIEFSFKFQNGIFFPITLLFQFTFFVTMFCSANRG